MPYTPPSGWIETRPKQATAQLVYRRFHQQHNCEAIDPTSTLAVTGRPNGIQRCRHCGEG